MSRPLWSGSIAFGLVSIPIELYPTTVDRTVRFHLVSPDGKCRLRRKLVCPDTGKEYDFAETARGYEVAPDEYVIVDPEELEALQPESGKTLELKQFVPLSEIDPVYFARTYFAFPKKGAEKPYSLLHSALSKTGQSGLGEFIMREREYVATVRAHGEMIYIDILHFHDELRKSSDVKNFQIEQKLNPRESKLAEQLISSLSEKFKPEQYRDDFRREVEALMKKKAKGKHVNLATPEKKTKNSSGGKVIDLMAKLEQSLKGKNKRAAGNQTARRTHGEKTEGSRNRHGRV